MLALLCFSLLLQIISLLSVYVLNSAYLIKASRQSTVDLSCISHAKEIIETNTFVRLCSFPKENLIIEKQADIMGELIQFYDRETYVECILENYIMRIYYDDKGIVGIEYKK